MDIQSRTHIPNVNITKVKEGGVALDSSLILQNYGSFEDHNLLDIFQFNEDDSFLGIKQSLYYDYDGLSQILLDNNEKISILNLNIQSLNSKFAQFQAFVNYLEQKDCHLDIICLQESWLKDDDDPVIFQINGYKIVSKNLNPNCSSHGGLLIYMKNTLDLIRYEKIDNCKTFEALVLYLKTSENRKYALVNLYKPPSNQERTIDNFLLEYFPIISKLQSENKDIIITGDFNINLLEINSNFKFQEFFDNMLNLNFLPKITLPTKFNNLSANLLDHIYHKSSSNNINTLSGVVLSSLSDHCPTFILIDDKKISKKMPPKFIYKTKCNAQCEENFKKELEDFDFDNLLTPGDNINNNYTKFIDFITHLKNKHFPITKVKFDKYKHKNNEWITIGILKSIKSRDQLYKKMLLTPKNTPNFQTISNSFKTYNVILKNLLQEAKKTYYFNVFEKNKSDMKKTWKNINLILKNSDKKSILPNFLLNNDKVITNKIDIAEHFNSYFVNIGPNLASTLKPEGKKQFIEYLGHKPNFNFRFENVSTESILDIINNLKSKNTYGFDRLSSKFLKKYKNQLTKPLTFLINQSLNSGIFPDQLKIAKVLPIYKNTELDDNDLNSYRPISILPTISKIFEKVVHFQLYNYLSIHNLLYKDQFGFRTNHSTELAALNLHDRILKYLDSDKIPIGIFLDLSKAFDTIDHTILIQKLSFYGLDENNINWFKSYLNNRQQYVFLDNQFSSSYLKIKTGVPQGSILGPLLFLIYVNDFPNCIKSSESNMLMYADDTCLLTSTSINTNKDYMDDILNLTLNFKLQQLYDWLVVNKLSLNTSKTKFIVFHFHQKRLNELHLPKLAINGKPISLVDNHKFLGIYFDCTLKFDKHIQQTSNKISRINGILSRLKHFLPEYILKLIYNTLLMPHLTYGITTWGFGNCYRLQSLQKKALRNITKSHFLAHCKPICKKINCLLFDDIFKVSILKFYYKFRCNTLPPYFYENNFVIDNTVQRKRRKIVLPKKFDDYNTSFLSNNQILYVPQTNKFNSRKCLRYYITTLINTNYITNDILNKIRTHSFQNFTYSCKQFIINNYEEECNDLFCYVCSKI